MTFDYRRFDVRFEGDVGILQLAEPDYYDTDDYADLQAELLRLARELQPRLLVVDFEAVTYCSTAVVNGLLQLRTELAKYGGQLKLSGLSPEVRDIFRCLRLEQTIFPIYETTATALGDC